MTLKTLVAAGLAVVALSLPPIGALAQDNPTPAAGEGTVGQTDPNATQFGNFYDILGQSLATGVGRPRLTNYGEVDQIIWTAVNSVATGAATPEDALKNADALVLDALKKAGYPAQ